MMNGMSLHPYPKGAHTGCHAAHWEVNRAKLASRVLFQRPAYYLPEQILQQHVRERVFSDRKPNATKYVAWLQ